ncbi:unnamed protein product [Heligmosomoides polygyrus]|uniref:Uncharacterized protein n=1 Tax=Heligmosomoides polygyrus TaxID=6339 RepID=A0A3P8C686_HELPZ|nr:unnamed protein product [Heligmosomoides polygyrus]
MWRVVNHGRELYGPNLISEIFPGLPEKIDAAVEIHGHIWIFSELYFMQGDFIYKMNTSDYRLPVAKGYPVPISKYWPFCEEQKPSSHYSAPQTSSSCHLRALIPVLLLLICLS